MVFVLLLIGVVLISVAYKGTQHDLFAELAKDIPNFGIMAAAIVALGIVGFIPGLKPISRGLLGLVILVIVFNNYDKVIPGFKNTFVSLGGPKSNTQTSNSSAIKSNGSGFAIPGLESFPGLGDAVNSAIGSVGFGGGM